MLSRREIVERWGGLLTGFEPAPPGHPIAASLPAGAVTDDTEQAVLLGRLLVQGHGTVDPRELAEALVSWERDMAARGSLDLLGPSTKRAVAAVLAGVPPEEAGAFGDHQRRRDAHRPRGHCREPGPPRAASLPAPSGPARSVGPRRPGGSGEPRHPRHRHRAGGRRGRGRGGQRGRIRGRHRRSHGVRRGRRGDRGRPRALGGRARTSRPASNGPPGWSRAWIPPPPPT